jgi:acetyl esterase/lipase
MISVHPAKQILVLTAVVLLGIAALVACAPVATLNALAARDTHALTENVAYGPLPRQRLDIFKPAAASPAGGYPVVVFFYGGSWNRGERADYRFVGEALASRGILTLVADYRLYPEVRYPDFLTDCAQALAYGLREARSLGGDPKRVFVMGHSAGAYNAVMLALDERWLRATGHSPNELAGFIGLAGPYDFLPITNPDAKPVFFHPDYPAGTQPIDHARRDAPRAFLAAPIDDKLVNPTRSTTGLAKRLKDAGATVQLKMYEHVNHMTLAAAFARPLRWLAPVLDDVAAFVNAERS